MEKLLLLTEFSHKVLFPWGQDRWVVKKKPMRFAKKGEAFMRCGSCGETDFTAIVKPTKLGAARVISLACSVCDKLYPINNSGETGGTLKPEVANARKREHINERADS